MRIFRCPIVFILSFVLLVTSCSGGAKAPVPRRTAYPRIAPYDTAYVEVDKIPLVLQVNSEAKYKVEKRDDGNTWINITYPKYSATIYCTLTSVDESNVEAVIDNRTERIHLNNGSATPQIIEIESPEGYFSDLVVNPSVRTTPIQFISVKRERPEWVLSGAVFFDNAESIETFDSVAPMIDVIHRDIVRMLQSLDNKP